MAVADQDKTRIGLDSYLFQQAAYRRNRQTEIVGRTARPAHHSRMMRTRAVAVANQSRKRSRRNELLMICMVPAPGVMLKQTQLICGRLPLVRLFCIPRFQPQ